MAQRDQADLPAGMERVRRQFEQWRRKRRGRDPIPEQLWVAAAGLAREYGVNATSRALSLDFNKLKALVKQKNPSRKRRSAAPQFLELVAASTVVANECVIELEGPRGKMRIEWKGSAAPDLAGLGRMLWEPE